MKKAKNSSFGRQNTSRSSLSIDQHKEGILMKTNEYPIELVQKCCAEYYDGKPVTEISKENQVARCTIYRWLKQYKNLSPNLMPLSLIHIFRQVSDNVLHLVLLNDLDIHVATLRIVQKARTEKLFLHRPKRHNHFRDD